MSQATKARKLILLDIAVTDKGKTKPTRIYGNPSLKYPGCVFVLAISVSQSGQSVQSFWLPLNVALFVV